VKALARQTAHATEAIDPHIGAVRKAAEAAVSAMQEVGAIVGRMDAVTTAISAAVEEQSVTAREIALNVQAVSSATDQAAHAMTEVVAAAEDAGHVSATVRTGVASIGQEAIALRGEIDDFLVAVRGAEGSAAVRSGSTATVPW
jgi:methyl-accepting chemotaxis protein